MLGKRFDDALAYASELHRADVRKETTIPYVAHLLGVCSLVLEHGGNEDEAIAALLHDAAEDHGGERQLAEIERIFGPKVAQIVRDCSDVLVEEGQSKGQWLPRKQQYVAHLAEIAAERPSSALVSAADKLYNLRSIDADLHRPEVGESVYARFSGRRWGTLWYYCALADVFSQVHGRHDEIARDLRTITDRLCDKHDATALLARYKLELDPKRGTST
jgi:(p)ppGpp synthase/HD superfamily hydrolase